MGEDSNQKNFKEQRVREITLMYYSREDVRKYMLKFSKNRECIPRYFEGFGKRPDAFQYESDILGHVKRGATSFHCSEELWSDPLEISTELSKQEMDDLRIGWDLLLDIDSPYLEYSKTYAEILVKFLGKLGIKNIGVKFSVSEDTDILIKLGNQIKLTQISEVIKLLKQNKKLKVLSLNKNRKLQFSKVYNYLEHEDILYEIFHFQSKIPLKATGHHSVFIWDRGGIIEKKVTEIKKGDFLISFNSNKNPLEKKISDISNIFEFSKNQFSKKIIKKKVGLTPELMRLIGYFLAEGHTTKIINQTGFSFNINEKEYIEDCKKILSDLTNRKISIRHPNTGSTQILIHSKEWHDFFKKLCGEKKDKHTPYFSWNLSKDLFLEMLKGYLRGDGYKVGKYNLVVKSVSKRLIKELVWLCKLNNISCSLSYEQNKPHELPQGTKFKGSFVYILKIPKSELHLPEFNKQRNKFSHYPGDKIFPIDGLKIVYQKIKPKMFNHHRVEQMTLKKKRANLNRIRKVLDWFEQYKSIDYCNECKKIIANYERLFNSDISVVEIKKIIKKDKQKVYDVSVEETESFFGNDYPILLHNSGSRGFHIIIPWKAFPKEIYGQKTKDMFPEWPRLICQYLAEKLKPELDDALYEKYEEGKSLNEIAKKMDKTEEDLVVTECISCNRPATKKILVTWTCSNCKNELTKIKENSRIPKCLDENCRKEMMEKTKKEIYFCEFCSINSNKNPEVFKKIIKLKHIEADLILVAPRHLFRMPYSLHEKTALASIAISPEKIKDFQITDAKPFKINLKEFYPDAKEEEAKNLLLQALDWNEQKQQKEKIMQKNIPPKTFIKNPGNKKISIPNPQENIFPPCIIQILKGIKNDGRKRALFILINFFKSIGMPEQEIEKKLEQWNEKNYNPLKKGYIQSQLIWYRKNPARLPPNCDKLNYKDLNLCHPDELCRKIKNPINYSMKKYFQKG